MTPDRAVEVLRLTTAVRPLDAFVDVPGSKSIANRALICAALTDGDSVLRNVPDGDDTNAMLRNVDELGAGVAVTQDVVVHGTAGRIRAPRHETLHTDLAGTTSRFLTALAALGDVPITIDGDPPLRRRPMGPLHEALRQLGATVVAPRGGAGLPVTVTGPLRRGGEVALAGDVSSQYVTALMLIAPLLDGGLRLRLTTPLVSVPYVHLTATVMASFGVDGVTVSDELIVVPPGRYRGTELAVEPDATSAGYPLAMAAVAGGRVGVRGLHRTSAQGDAAFADLLGRMGCTVDDGGRGLTVTRDPSRPIVGIDVDMADLSDLVPTLAVVAATARTATTIHGVGFIRHKESDRLGDLAAGLGSLGATVEVEPDGLHIEPADPLHGARLATHHDHRLAMAYGVLGTVVEGLEVVDPAVVAKSWPGFWVARDRLLAGR